MSRTRRILALVCIAAMIVAAFAPAASHALAAVLVPLGPLFGTVTSVAVPEASRFLLPAAPVVSIRSPRAPPLA